MADHRTLGFHRMRVMATCTLMLAIAASIGSIAQTRVQAPGSTATNQTVIDKATQTLDRQTPVFIENRGQWDSRARFLLRSSGLDTWITDHGVVYDIHRIEQSDAKHTDATTPSADSATFTVRRAAVSMRFLDADFDARAHGTERAAGYHNYFIGSDQTRWATNVPLYGAARIENLYAGIDAVFYLDNGRPRYDLVVAPGADVAQVAMQFDGAEKIRIDASGSLVIATSLGEVQQRELYAYQERDGKRQQVPCAFQQGSDGVVRFSVGDYDRTRPLVVDPVVIAYSTYLGGSGDEALSGIAVDGSGNAYISGHTSSTNFPTLNAAQGSFAGTSDVFVTKLTASGALSYSTYLGGSGAEVGGGIAIDASGNAHITGHTSSTNFPTLSAAQSSNAGGANDAFVTKLTSSGALSYSTYLGGSSDEAVRGIIVDGSGNAYIGGYTPSTNYPTLNAAQSSFSGILDVFMTKLTSSGALSYSTYLGGSNDDRALHFAVDGSGSVYITGIVKSTNFPTLSAIQSSNGGGVNDAFVTKLTSSGALSYSTYLGGSGEDVGAGIAIDGSGNVHIIGYTTSGNFPTLNAAQSSHAGDYDAFVTKLTSSGTLSYSTYLGGSGGDASPLDITFDGSGNAYIRGATNSTNFPTLNAAQSSYGGGVADAFLTKLTTGGALSYSTYLGGSDEDGAAGLAVDGSGNAYITGFTRSTDFPTLNAVQSSYGGGGRDAFLTKLTSSGAFSYSSYFGGSDNDGGSGIAIDGSGNAYIRGTTSSTNLPTLNAAQASNGGGTQDAFVAKFVFASISNLSLSGTGSHCAGSTVTVSWQSTGVSSVDIDFSTDGGSTWSSVATSQTSGSNGGSYSWTVPGSTGTNRMIRVTDASIGSINATSATFIINAPPTVTTHPQTNTLVCPGTSVTFTAAADGVPTPVVQWQRSTDNGATFSDLTGETSTTLTISSPTASMNGYRYRATFQNSCSAATTTAATLQVGDDTDPTITAPGSVTVDADQGVCLATGISLGTPQTGDNCVVASVTNDAPPSFPIGMTTVTWTVTDGSGNSATAMQTVTVIDNQPPVPSVASLPAVSGECSATVTPPTADDCAGVITGTTLDPLSYAEEGSYTITWTYDDGRGNTSTQQQSVEVHDMTAPTITAPANVTATTATGTCGRSSAGVSLGMPVVHDNCTADEEITVSNDAPTTFPTGTTIVTWMATDAAGRSATATQLVTVNDDEDPVITAPANRTVNADQGSCSATGVALGTPVTSDNCTVASITNDAPSSYPAGPTTVVWTVTDGSSNTSTATQTVTVVDNVRPVISGIASVTIDADAGSCSATSVALGNVTAVDNCSGTVTLTNNAPATYTVGTHTITWTATDASGNTETATQTVIVSDNSAPTLTLATDAVLWSPNHSYSTFGVGSMVTGVSDNCTSGLTADDAVIWKVTSDETENENHNGDGNTLNDIVIASDCKSVQLRAERQNNGNGRVYRVYVRIADDNGNTSSSSTYYTVSVPHSQNGTAAVDDNVVNYEQSCGNAKPVTGEAMPGYLLMQNHPNPFSAATTIEYLVPTSSHVSLIVYDAQGAEIATIVDAYQASGTHRARFDGTTLASGTYTYVLRSNRAVLARTMVLVR